MMAEEKIRVRCSSCGKQFRVSSDMAGKKARCPCGNVIDVPRPPSSDELARKWYYAKQGERYGPVPQSRLARLLRDGELGPEDYVWTKGMTEWRPAREVKQFQEILQQGAAAPAAAPAGQTAEQEQAGAEAEAEEAASVESKSEETAPDAAEEAASASREALATPQAAAPPAEQEPAAPEPAEPAQAAEQEPKAQPAAAKGPVKAAKPATPPAAAAGQAAAEPSTAPAAAATMRPSRWSRALSLLLCVVGALCAAGGVAVVVWERLAHVRFGTTPLGPQFILGGLLILGLGHLLNLAGSLTQGLSELNARLRQERENR